MPIFPRTSVSRKPISEPVMPKVQLAEATVTTAPARAGEVVTLLGRNGAGKTTTLKSIMGILAKRSGSIRFNGHEIIRTSSDKIARLGIAFCPEERGIFSSLDV